MAYNEKGNFTGVATVIFKSSKSATLAVKKYNNAPIDGGASKLRLELIVDPTKKPLAARITANAEKNVANNGKTKAQLKKDNLKAKLQKKKAELKQQQVKKVEKKKTEKKKAAKPEKKTAEQLDQEMSDYFNN